jgi:tmRNA-binding protein
MKLLCERQKTFDKRQTLKERKIKKYGEAMKKNNFLDVCFLQIH